MTARIVLQSNGKPRRMLLSQPPGYRNGTDPAPAVCPIERGIDIALRNADRERAQRSKSSGTKSVRV